MVPRKKLVYMRQKPIKNNENQDRSLGGANTLSCKEIIAVKVPH